MGTRLQEPVFVRFEILCGGFWKMFHVVLNTSENADHEMLILTTSSHESRIWLLIMMTVYPTHTDDVVIVPCHHLRRRHSPLHTWSRIWLLIMITVCPKHWRRRHSSPWRRRHSPLHTWSRIWLLILSSTFPLTLTINVHTPVTHWRHRHSQPFTTSSQFTLYTLTTSS